MKSTNKAFDVLKEALERLSTYEAYDKEVAKNTTAIKNDDLAKAIEFMKKHAQVQEHPDMFFHREMPERVLIDINYLSDVGGFAKTANSKEQKENNEGYNLCKRVLGLPEYQEH